MRSSSIRFLNNAFFDKKDVFHTVLVFMYIFAFHLRDGAGVHSGMLVFAYLIVFTAMHKDFFQELVKTFFSKYVFGIVVAFIATNFWILFCLLVNWKWDFSFMKTFVHMFFQFGLGIYLYRYLLYWGYATKTVTYVIVAFFAQTIIQWSVFLIPPFRAIINLTKSYQTIQIGMSYAGMRAVGLSGSDFFGLSSAYAIALLTYWSSDNLLFKNNRIIKLLAYCFLMSGTFFAGRTGFIGVFFAGMYGFALVIQRRISGESLVFALNKNEKPIAKAAAFFVGASLFLAVILFFVSENFYNLITFAFQPVFSLFAKGTFEISSLSKMFDMYFAIPFKTLLVGDGMYTALEGGYYMNTDVGYMRVILYMGVVGFVLMLLLQISLMRINQGKEILLKWMTLLCLLVLNLKGEVIAWSLLVQGCVILFCLQTVREYPLENNVNLRDNK